MRRLVLLLAGCTSVALATPPPLPPIAVVSGPIVACATRFALDVRAGETAERHGAEWWVLKTGAGELGVRGDGPPIDPRATPFRPEDGRRGRVMTVQEYPGERRWGWWYWLGDETEPLFAAAPGNGAAAANPLLNRILEGAARDQACGPRR